MSYVKTIPIVGDLLEFRIITLSGRGQEGGGGESSSLGSLVVYCKW